MHRQQQRFCAASVTSATIGFSDNAAARQRCVAAGQQQHLHQHLRHLQRP
jgi:hypothetical protein